MEILKYNPCQSAVEFRKKYDSFEDAWNNCLRGDWMLWIASKLNVDFKKLTRAKAECAKTVIHLMRDDRSKKAIEVAIDFSIGKASKQDLKMAYAAAYAAAADAVADAAAAYAAAGAAAYAAYSADAAAYSADAAYAGAKKQNQLETANICRKYLTDVVFEKLGLIIKAG